MSTMLFKKSYVALQYLRYRLGSATAHDLHSPFVFDFYNNVVKDETPFYAFSMIEAARSKMILSDEKILVHDFGTGGKNGAQKKRSVRFIAGHHVKPPKYGQLLFRMVNAFRPSTILELGTSLGITTMYLAAPHSHANVITVEGCPGTAAAAKKNFQVSGIKNISQVTGEFSMVLPEILQNNARLDFVFFDGNHRKDTTLNYFYQCLAKHTEDSVFVFDDIHWSPEMQSAWETIRQHEAVTLTLDLFFFGVVFFRKGIPRQHFVLKY